MPQLKAGRCQGIVPTIRIPPRPHSAPRTIPPDADPSAVGVQEYVSNDQSVADNPQHDQGDTDLEPRAMPQMWRKNRRPRLDQYGEKDADGVWWYDVEESVMRRIPNARLSRNATPAPYR